MTDALLNQTAFTIDAAGNVLTRIEGLGTAAERVAEFTYDPLNRKLTETDGTGATTTFRYDPAGNEVEVIDATGIATSKSYDERGRLLVEDDPAQGTVTRSYDLNGNLETVANALGNTVTVTYDAANRVTQTTDPLGHDRLFAYDAQDNLTGVTDARGNTTTFVFDPLGREIRRVNPLGETRTQTYDSRDNLTGTGDAKGQEIVRAYDSLSRLTQLTTVRADETVEDVAAFTYDAQGNRLTAADGDSSLAFTYDPLNRKLTESTVAGTGTVQPAVTLTATHDPAGNRTGLTASDGAGTVGAWVFAYDDAGRLSGLTSPAADNVTLGYDPAGRLVGIGFPNQIATTVLYNELGRPVGITDTLVEVELRSLAYGFDAEGKITSIEDETGGLRTFAYDAFQQLTAGGFATAPESYSYDEEGNRITSHLSAAHVHDPANRLLEDDSFCYAYDLNGNLASKTAKVSGACTGGVTAYSWDVQNRLTRIDFPDATFAAYRYDPDGRRIEKDINGTITRYIYDGENIVLEYDGANALLARYSHGDRVDQPLVQDRAGQSYFYHIDHLGSVRRLTDAAGAVVNVYDYDGFGRFEMRVEGVANPYAFTAREFDEESGLIFYRTRYYSAELGRFIAKDTIGFESNDFNLYRYVFGDPVNLTDPSGNVALLGYARRAGLATVSKLSRARFFRIVMNWKNAVKANRGGRLQPYSKSGQYLCYSANEGRGSQARCALDVTAQLYFGYKTATEGKNVGYDPYSPAGRLARALGFYLGAGKTIFQNLF